MSVSVGQMKKQWEERASQLGKTKRAVLFKRFPSFLNAYIHYRHSKFVVQNVSNKTKKVLDVGCGYGRISNVIANHYPKAVFTGIELCRQFAMQYENCFGSCFNGCVQDFSAENNFDAIIIVTLLMYLPSGDRQNVINRLWKILQPQGRLICIEPAREFLSLWHKLSGFRDASPTGGDVHHFSMPEIIKLFSKCEGAEVLDRISIRLIPFLKETTLHYGAAFVKNC